jgi:hypothetical protein
LQFFDVNFECLDIVLLKKKGMKEKYDKKIEEIGNE